MHEKRSVQYVCLSRRLIGIARTGSDREHSGQRPNIETVMANVRKKILEHP